MSSLLICLLAAEEFVSIVFQNKSIDLSLIAIKENISIKMNIAVEEEESQYIPVGSLFEC